MLRNVGIAYEYVNFVKGDDMATIMLFTVRLLQGRPLYFSQLRRETHLERAPREIVHYD